MVIIFSTARGEPPALQCHRVIANDFRPLPLPHDKSNSSSPCHDCRLHCSNEKFPAVHLSALFWEVWEHEPCSAGNKMKKQPLRFNSPQHHSELSPAKDAEVDPCSRKRRGPTPVNKLRQHLLSSHFHPKNSTNCSPARSKWNLSGQSPVQPSPPANRCQKDFLKFAIFYATTYHKISITLLPKNQISYILHIS